MPMVMGQQLAKRGGSSAASWAMVSFSVMSSAKSGESLAGRVALVTGSAKRLGRAGALRLAEEGAEVVIHYRSSAGGAPSAVAPIQETGRGGLAIAARLT